MELALNLGWLALAITMCWLRLRHARREGPRRQVQFIALALILAIMFAVIPMYDDMAMAQNPAETSCFAHEDFSSVRAHVMLHPVDNFSQSLDSEVSSEVIYLGVVGDHPAQVLRSPSLRSIQNRPPPVG